MNDRDSCLSCMLDDSNCRHERTPLRKEPVDIMVSVRERWHARYSGSAQTQGQKASAQPA